MTEELTMPGFVIRTAGSREYLPKEYRGAPQDFYATRMRESMRNRTNSIQMKRANAAGLERDLYMNNELARLRARYRQLVNKTRLLKHNSGISVTEKPRIRFAPRV